MSNSVQLCILYHKLFNETKVSTVNRSKTISFFLSFFYYFFLLVCIMSMRADNWSTFIKCAFNFRESMVTFLKHNIGVIF